MKKRLFQFRPEGQQLRGGRGVYSHPTQSHNRIRNHQGGACGRIIFPFWMVGI